MSRYADNNNYKNSNRSRSRSRSPPRRNDRDRDNQRDNQRDNRDNQQQGRKRHRDASAHGQREDFSRRGGDPLLNTMRDIRTGVNLSNRLMQKLLAQMGVPLDQIPQAGKQPSHQSEKNDQFDEKREEKRERREEGEYDE